MIRPINGIKHSYFVVKGISVLRREKMFWWSFVFLGYVVLYFHLVSIRSSGRMVWFSIMFRWHMFYYSWCCVGSEVTVLASSRMCIGGFWGIAFRGELPRSYRARRVASTRVDVTTFGLLASNVCIFIQLSITSLSVTSLSMTSLAQVLSGDGVR